MINIRVYDLKKFLDRQLYITYLTWLLTLCWLLTITVIYIGGKVYDGVIDDYNKKLHLIYDMEGDDINLMCNVISCKNVLVRTPKGETTYKSIGGILKRSNCKLSTDPFFYYKNINKDFLTLIYIDNKVFFVDDKKYVELLESMVFLIWLIIFILFTALGIGKTLYESKAEVLQRNAKENEITTKLQRDLTESLHHELGMPVALTESLITEIFSKMYPCPYTVNGVCAGQSGEVEPEKCCECNFFLNRRSTDDIAINYYRKIIFNIERIKSTLRLIANSKHIKYSNGTVSIFRILDNIVSGINSYKVNKIEAFYESMDIFNKHAVGYGISNGDMMNVVNIMVNNCIEAKATQVTFFAEYIVKDKVIALYIKDNGRGIRDAMDNIVNDEMIFQYGFSTKDESGEQLIATTKLERFLLKLGINIINTGSPRGVGLSVGKGILQKAGGDVAVHSTSTSGTIFKITLPVKEKRNEN